MVARLGGSWYARITEDSLFEIPKPISTKGIGVDQLPTHIFETEVLSNNNIGRLGNVEKIPTEDELEKFKKTSEIASVLKLSEARAKREAIHILVKEHLEKGEMELAVLALFSI